MKFPSKEHIKGILNTKKYLCEMRYAPDQQIYGLTRRQAEELLAKYERRADQNGWNDDPEYRSVEGWKKARWFPPEATSDFVPEQMLKNNTQERPAKLMPYDYFYNVYDSPKNKSNHFDIDNDDDKYNSKDYDWKGETNTY